jgi:hypothetical protein
MFVRASRRRFVNLHLAREIRQQGGEWFADFDNYDAPVELGNHERDEIETTLSTIVAAHPDEILHRLIGWSRDNIEHEMYRIIAWRIPPASSHRHPEPVIATEILGTNATTITMIQHPDGRLEETYVQDYASLDAAKDELLRRMAATDHAIPIPTQPQVA